MGVEVNVSHYWIAKANRLADAGRLISLVASKFTIGWSSHKSLDCSFVVYIILQRGRDGGGREAIKDRCFSKRLLRDGILLTVGITHPHA